MKIDLNSAESASDKARKIQARTKKQQTKRKQKRFFLNEKKKPF
jgi:hypothetical protein